MPVPRLDVLVVGSGAAGLYAALCLPAEYRVGLITKDVLRQSASDWAQGGIAAAIAPEDSPRFHKADTLKAGAGLCDNRAVEQLVEQAGECIRALVELGVPFDYHQGQLALTLEAAHSQRRVLHAADATGRAVVSTLAAAVRRRSNIQVFEQTLMLDLWMQDARCQGIIAIRHQSLEWWPTGAVVLATGGGGQVFSQTTNPPASTGDGVAMAWRAGAQLRDLEFFQFHPTALKVEAAPRFLISEAVRGEGAHLIDATGQRFAFQYHPQGELAPRDVVSRAIYRHLQKKGPSDPDWVWLDLHAIPEERIRYRFPNIIAVCQRWGIDPFQHPIPVSPAAHYWMGGVVTDTASQTTLSQLYAVGETASTGVHGANRLASNSLLECLVYGRQLQSLQPGPLAPLPPAVEATTTIEISAEDQQALTDLRSTLPELVWQGAGISRHAAHMIQTTSAVAELQCQFSQLAISRAFRQALAAPASYALKVPPETARLWSEARNLLDLGYLILSSAYFRTESRGGHYREDYPASHSDWQQHTMVQGDRWWKAAVGVDDSSP